MASYCVLMLQKILIDKRYLMKNVILFENPFKFYFTFTATQKHFIVGLQVVFFYCYYVTVKSYQGNKKNFYLQLLYNFWTMSCLPYLCRIHTCFCGCKWTHTRFFTQKKNQTQWWIFHDLRHNFHYIFHCMTDTDKCFHFVYQCCLPDYGHKAK
jgi:hypothetical protein